jgi:thiol-disulfide isomerase/thioredoxin
MSDPNSSGPRGISPWWTLLILPIAAGIGWGIGLAPTDGARKPAAVTSASAPAPPADPSPIHVDVAPGTGDAGVPVAAAPPPSDNASRPAEISNWTSYDSAVEESRRTGKPILLDFNAAWCGPCRMLKSQVFDDPGFGRRVQLAVIPVSVTDRQREDGRNSDEVESLMIRWRIEAFPTLIVYSPSTGQSDAMRGYGGAEYTANWIAQTAERVR